MSRISWMSGPGRRDDRHNRFWTSINTRLGPAWEPFPSSSKFSLGWIYITGTHRDVVMRDAFSV